MTPRDFPVLLRRRTATTAGAIILGLVALAFAWAADEASKLFEILVEKAPYAPLVVTPVGLATIVALTRRIAPQARGSGIPQVSAGAEDPKRAVAAGLISIKTAIFKLAATVAALLIGTSVGREGPTVQISAAIMAFVHRTLKIELSAAVVIAGGAAGVSAAFNTPLAGIAFAIEELASSYHQRLALLAMAAVMISGLVSLGIAGDYVYFGAIHEMLPLKASLIVSPLAGVLGGLCGGLFSRTVLAFGSTFWVPVAALRRRPIILALLCGLLVAICGVITGGATWGAGYDYARQLVESHTQPFWFGPAKFFSTLVTMLSGVPGGIFAPSLATGAGVGNLLALVFPNQPLGAVVLLGMIGYFVGVVRAPLTAVIIISEMTDSRAMVLPLLAAAIIADGVSAMICHEKLYHALSKAFTLPQQQEGGGKE
ncbi:chloride channel protein [Labrys miyagiensis]|uniref:Chloride channel protein n=1 Tax=Labrys miyagiensis TaxID=346912 RepID=A0ABQ6CD96_9HYPH|nr:chloride channel protein [Labrys miyagiensis]GLS18241.1 chloride channel protein [Labrys miyagiensis]